MKYSNVKLPHDLSDVLGYYMDCYRKFAALGKTDREDLRILLCDKQETTKVTTCQSSSNAHILLPQTGIFQRICIL